MSGEQVTCTTQSGQSFPCVYNRNDVHGGIGAVFFFAIFCAYWAQTTGRNSWLWFFAGLIVAPIAALALLYKNSIDIHLRKK